MAMFHNHDLQSSNIFKVMPLRGYCTLTKNKHVFHFISNLSTYPMTHSIWLFLLREIVANDSASFGPDFSFEKLISPRRNFIKWQRCIWLNFSLEKLGPKGALSLAGILLGEIQAEGALSLAGILLGQIQSNEVLSLATISSPSGETLSNDGAPFGRISPRRN